MLDNETVMEILKDDKEETQREYQEAVEKLIEARKEIDQKDMQVDKV